MLWVIKLKETLCLRKSTQLWSDWGLCHTPTMLPRNQAQGYTTLDGECGDSGWW